MTANLNTKKKHCDFKRCYRYSTIPKICLDLQVLINSATLPATVKEILT